jgi:hypothetical protein
MVCSVDKRQRQQGWCKQEMRNPEGNINKNKASHQTIVNLTRERKGKLKGLSARTIKEESNNNFKGRLALTAAAQNKSG